ncbi:MAG TPA: ComF family protein [Terriglobales bacterium]|nr:ComF family protein [Terriglobales bacterium]
MAEGLFATLFPADCRLCGTPLTNISRLPVCLECLAAMRPIAGGVCSVCGERLASEHAFSGQYGEPKCGLCLRLDPPFERAAAYGSYSGGLRELIHLLKYEQVRPAANVLGRMLAEVIAGMAPGFAASEVLVVPVPLHVRKLRERGFNQSELIARAACRLKPAGERLVMCPKALERKRETRSQIGLSSHQRRENMRGAFAVTAPDQVYGHEVLLVDDVLTTGTTASECARMLRRAGASKIWVATVARTLKEHANSAVPDHSDEPMTMAAHGS